MSTVKTRPGNWLEQNCRLRPDGIWFDNDGNFYRVATEDEAQRGHNDTWPGDPVSVAPPAEPALVERLNLIASGKTMADAQGHVAAGYHPAEVARDAAAELSRLQRELDEARARLHDNQLIADGAYDRANAAEATLAERTAEVEAMREALQAVDSEVLLTGQLKDVVDAALNRESKT